MSFAELTLCEQGSVAGSARRVRIYAPNVFDLESMNSSIDEIELNGCAGMILEDGRGMVVGWLLPGEKLNELELSRLRATRAHLIALNRQSESHLVRTRAA